MFTYLLCMSYSSGDGVSRISPMRSFEDRADAEKSRDNLNAGRVHDSIEYIVIDIEHVPS